MNYRYEYRYRDPMRKGKWSQWYGISDQIADLSRGKQFFEVRERKHESFTHDTAKE